MSDTNVDDDDLSIGGPDEEVEDDVQDEGEEEADVGQDESGPVSGEGRDEKGDELQVKPSRASEAVRRAKAERDEARKQFSDLQREINEIRASQVNRGPSPEELARQQAEEAQRVSLMAPHEVAQYYATKAQTQMEQRLQMMQMSLQEQNDRASFTALQATDPLARKYADEVEKVVRDQQARGMIVSRDVALNYVIGQAMRKRAASASTRQGKAAAARVNGATAKSVRANGDATADRGRMRGDMSIEALERRIGDVKF